MQLNHLNRRQFIKIATLAAGALASYGVIPTAIAQQLEPAGSADLAFTGNLEFWDWRFDPRAELMQRLIDEWQAANPGIQLDYTTYGYSDLQTRLLTGVSAATNPPFSNVHANWRYELQRADALAAYPETVFDFDTLFSTTYNRDPRTGAIYTSTFNYYGDVVFYNEEILAEEGLTADDIPTSWDEFIRFAQQLTRRDDRNFVTRPGAALNHYFSQEWLWTSMVYQQGEFLYNEAGDRALWNSEAGVAALELIRRWYNDSALDDYNLLRHFEQFANGEAAMFISHGYWADSLITEYPALAGKWGTRPIPTFTGAAEPAWGMVLPEEGFTVFNNASEEEQAVAFSFIEYMLGPDAHRQLWSEVMRGPSDRLDLLGSTNELDDTGSVIASLSETMPYRIYYGERPIEAEALWRTMFEEVIINNSDAQTALDTVTDAMNAVFAETGPRLITERNYTPPTNA